MELVYVVLLGFLIDLILGDPPWMPHPVIYIGRLISLCEKILRKVFPKTERGEIIAGFFLTVTVIGISTVLPYFVLYCFEYVNPWIKYALEVFWCWQIFASKSLAKAAKQVRNEIEKNDIKEARKYVSYIVGRDTQALDFKQIIKAVCETVAENTSDGIIAPMFYLIIGGVPMGFFYKAGNTLDSMVGYKNEKYLNFGKVSAVFDDILNFIPARITGFIMCIASFLCGLNGKNAFKIFFRDRRNHVSPNAGNPESACAGALGVELLGDASYFGKVYKKKTIGDALKEIENSDIEKTNRLMYASAVLSLILMAGIRALIFIYIVR
ncbi:MAG: adenosylcobinamide-phosphate synthase CbiB [Hornefia sp.]|nr:adenosylcobinamide-phosphate synthase CbiB [Hornefia sp.]